MRKLEILSRVLLGAIFVFSVVWGLGKTFPQNDLKAGKVVENPGEISEEVNSKNPLPKYSPQEKLGLQDLKKEKPREGNMPVIVLGKRNTVTFRGPVTQQSVARTQRKIFDKSANLPDNATIYLAVDSPGGSITAGRLLIDSVKAIPQDVKTISLFSASMAFHMVQNFDDRYILPSSTLMSHRASVGGLRCEIGSDGGECVQRIRRIIRTLHKMDSIAADRMDMELDKYQKLVRDEYWAGGSDAVAEKSADKTVLVRCKKSLTDSREKATLRTLFGRMELVYSGCPLITYPEEINRGGLTFSNKAEKKKFNKFLNRLLSNKSRFVENYILDNSYKEFLPVKTQ